MYNNRIVNTESEIEEKDLIEIEDRYGFKFPESFRKHYLKFNSGYLERDLFITKDGIELPFSAFYPIRREDERKGLELINMLKVNFDKDSICPKWLVAFADEICGGEFCWSRREYEYGSIYYWDCNINLGDDPSKSDDYAIKIADSLEEFINNMVEEE